MTYIPPDGKMSVSGNTTLTETKQNIFVSASGGAVTITLPAASIEIDTIIVKTDSSLNGVVISAPSGTINGASTVTLSTQYASKRVISDGTNYIAI